MKRAILAAVLLLLAATAQAQQPFVTLDPGGEAWWLRARFNPVGTEVRGLPVAQIAKDWCKATEFTWDLFKDVLAEEGTKASDYGYATFSVEGRFDRSKITQIALVGVYETCSGERGEFFLVIDKDSRKIRFLAAGPVEYPFNALIPQRDSTIRILHCLECDHSDVLRWDAKKKKFGWVQTHEDQFVGRAKQSVPAIHVAAGTSLSLLCPPYKRIIPHMKNAGPVSWTGVVASQPTFSVPREGREANCLPQPQARRG
ncbi:MAG: hypothetical protein WDO17_21260 [Alphaproteobacteria bacterium]